MLVVVLVIVVSGLGLEDEAGEDAGAYMEVIDVLLGSEDEVGVETESVDEELTDAAVCKISVALGVALAVAMLVDVSVVIVAAYDIS